MPAQPRPTVTESVTNQNLWLGMPVVEFGPTIGGIPQPLVNLGIVDDASLQKEIEEIALESSHSGIRSTVRELLTKLKPTFDVTVFNHAADVLQFGLGSSSKTLVSANAAAAVSNERVRTTTDPQDFLDLRQQRLNAGSLVVTPATISAEQVGVGDGTKGAVLGDYKLAKKVRLVADVSGTIDVDLNGTITSFTPVAVGGHGTGLKVEVVVGTASDSGNLQFFNGAGAVNVTGIISATYTPSFTLTEGVGAGTLTAVAAAQSDDGGAFTNETSDANSAGAGDVTLTPAVPVVNDAFYVGAVDRFDRVRVVVSTAGVGQTLVWEYHNGSAWTALANVTDKSVGFTVAGTHDVTWDAPSDWKQLSVNSVGPFFYVRARVTAVSTPTGAVGTQLWTSNSDDYLADYKGGRLRIASDADKSSGHRPLIAGQEVEVDYTFNRLAYTALQPFTQTTFLGRARVRLLSDLGGNVVWNIPAAQIKVTDEELAFSDDDFSTITLGITVLDDPIERFGTLEVYTEAQAAGA